MRGVDILERERRHRIPAIARQKRPSRGTFFNGGQVYSCGIGVSVAVSSMSTRGNGNSSRASATFTVSPPRRTGVARTGARW